MPLPADAICTCSREATRPWNISVRSSRRRINWWFSSLTGTGELLPDEVVGQVCSKPHLGHRLEELEREAEVCRHPVAVCLEPQPEAGGLGDPRPFPNEDGAFLDGEHLGHRLEVEVDRARVERAERLHELRKPGCPMSGSR